MMDPHRRKAEIQPSSSSAATEDSNSSRTRRLRRRRHRPSSWRSSNKAQHQGAARIDVPAVSGLTTTTVFVAASFLFLRPSALVFSADAASPSLNSYSRSSSSVGDDNPPTTDRTGSASDDYSFDHYLPSSDEEAFYWSGNNGSSEDSTETPQPRTIKLADPPRPLPLPFPQQAARGEREEQERVFMEWCKSALGIETILEIQTFDYYNYMKALPDEDWDDGGSDENGYGVPVESLPMIPVRGLAASRDIEEGETVIRIPLKALVSVSRTIDQDPVLSRVMGPEARIAHGWVSEEQDDASFLDLPLLAVALLHHRKVGAASQLSPYLRILENTPVDSMPFLWSKERLKSEVSEGIRAVARGIRREIQEMYTTFVEPLVEEHPDLFGRPASPVDGDWMFSIEKFRWAFAIINSRHWQLPVQSSSSDALGKPAAASADSEGVVPPASMPTDSWLLQDHATDGFPESHEMLPNSFLAPVADLLNFGPPCTRGSYNKDYFEIKATCSFQKGQEVTFWYSDECDHVMVGIYGFTHPIVPRCPSAEEYRHSSIAWREEAESLKEQLKQAHEILSRCDCYDKPTKLQPDRSQEDIGRHGVRRRYIMSRKSEF